MYFDDKYLIQYGSVSTCIKGTQQKLYLKTIVIDNTNRIKLHPALFLHPFLPSL